MGLVPVPGTPRLLVDPTSRNEEGGGESEFTRVMGSVFLDTGIGLDAPGCIDDELGDGGTATLSELALLVGTTIDWEDGLVTLRVGLDTFGLSEVASDAAV